MNLLAKETSPYLRQHMDNPVEWMPWNETTLERARREDKPILLSIGYSACHWCHVMAHESFENEDIAALMNQHFINIKVDREERPDIDAVYQGALSLMGQAGGWPLTMFLTPDGKPFWGGTYFPPQPRYGMPSFTEVLRGVAESFGRDKGKIKHNVQSLTAAMDKINSSQPGSMVHGDMLDKTSAAFLKMVDPANGGIGSQPKFPNLPVMGLLWDSYIRTGDDRYKFAVIHSLTQMCQGGIYDHIAGGFARYSVDAEWLVPHFEKMLYDNALFITLLSEIYKETRHPLFAKRISETIGWMKKDLTIRNISYSAFASSLDADSEGIEGKYYVWMAEEIDEILVKDAEVFKKIYDVTKFGNWEGVNILNRLKNPDYPGDQEEMLLEHMREKLRKVRSERVPPHLDNKILADWNGLAISALASAGEALGHPEWIETAENIFSFITTCMMDNEGRLHHTWCDGKARHPALLEDYANMADAALGLYAATANPDFLAKAVKWVDILNDEFWDKEHHGYFMSSSRMNDLPVRPKSAHDNASPSGNGTMVGVLARLYHLAGEEGCLDRAEKISGAFSGEIIHHAFPFATLLRNCGFLFNPLSIIIVAEPDAADVKFFHDVLKKFSLPSLIKTTILHGSILPKGHPAFGKTAIEGKTTVYACFGHHCLAPVTGPQELEEILRNRLRYRAGMAAANDG